jgi:hypothetical protein
VVTRQPLNKQDRRLIWPAPFNVRQTSVIECKNRAFSIQKLALRIWQHIFYDRFSLRCLILYKYAKKEVDTLSEKRIFAILNFL